MTSVLPHELSLLIGLIPAFSVVAFMLQSRHHSINDHERSLQDKYEKLNEKHKKQSVYEEIIIVRERYDAALLAFILLMCQIIVLLIMIIFISIDRNVLSPLYACSLFLGVIAYTIHIFGDLIKAYSTQKINRNSFDTLFRGPQR